MTLPHEIILRVVDQVISDDFAMFLETYMIGHTPPLTCISLAHCNSFMREEVPKRYFERATTYGNMRWGEYMSVEESLRWEWEDQWKAHESGVKSGWSNGSQV